MTKAELKALMHDKRREIPENSNIQTYLMTCVDVMFDVAAEAIAAKLQELKKGAQ